MARWPRFRSGPSWTQLVLVALVAALAPAVPLPAQEPDNANVAHAARYANSPIADGLRHVLAANRFSAFLGPDGHTGAPGPLGALAREAELEGHALLAFHAIEDGGLAGHWDATTSPVRAALDAGHADVLMVALGPEGADEGIDRFTDLLMRSGSAGRILVQDVWSTGAGDRASSARLEGLHAQLASINQRAGHEMAYLVPAADAVERLRWDVALGKVPGLARQEDLFPNEGGRAAEPVENLVTYLWFTVMYRQPATGLTALVDPGDPTSAERELALQQIAWDAASAEPASGIMVEHIWLGRSRGVHPHPVDGGDGHGGHMPPTAQGDHAGHE